MLALRVIPLVLILLSFTTAVAVAGGLLLTESGEEPVDTQGIVRFPEERPAPEGWEKPVTLKLFQINVSARSDVLADTPLRVVETETIFDAASGTSSFTLPDVAPGIYNVTIESLGTLMIARRSVTLDGAGAFILDMGTLRSGNVKRLSHKWEVVNRTALSR